MKKILVATLALMLTFGCVGLASCLEDSDKESNSSQTQTGEVTVTFNSDGGDAVDSQTFLAGDTALKPISPTKSGFAFQYWALDGEEFDFNTPVESSITLTAVWKAVVYVEISFDTSGGTAVDTQRIVEGGKVSLPGAPSKAGYDFVYWALNGEEFDPSNAVSESITLTAVWGAIKTEATRLHDLPDGWDFSTITVKKGEDVVTDAVTVDATLGQFSFNAEGEYTLYDSDNTEIGKYSVSPFVFENDIAAGFGGVKMEYGEQEIGGITRDMFYAVTDAYQPVSNLSAEGLAKFKEAAGENTYVNVYSWCTFGEEQQNTNITWRVNGYDFWIGDSSPNWTKKTFEVSAIDTFAIWYVSDGIANLWFYLEFFTPEELPSSADEADLPVVSTIGTPEYSLQTVGGVKRNMFSITNNVSGYFEVTDSEGLKEVAGKNTKATLWIYLPIESRNDPYVIINGGAEKRAWSSDWNKFEIDLATFTAVKCDLREVAQTYNIYFYFEFSGAPEAPAEPVWGSSEIAAAFDTVTTTYGEQTVGGVTKDMFYAVTDAYQPVSNLSAEGLAELKALAGGHTHVVLNSWCEFGETNTNTNITWKINGRDWWLGAGDWTKKVFIVEEITSLGIWYVSDGVASFWFYFEFYTPEELPSLEGEDEIAFQTDANVSTLPSYGLYTVGGVKRNMFTLTHNVQDGFFGIKDFTKMKELADDNTMGRMYVYVPVESQAGKLVVGGTNFSGGDAWSGGWTVFEFDLNSVEWIYGQFQGAHGDETVYFYFEFYTPEA